MARIIDKAFTEKGWATAGKVFDKSEKFKFSSNNLFIFFGHTLFFFLIPNGVALLPDTGRL